MLANRMKPKHRKPFSPRSYRENKWVEDLIEKKVEIAGYRLMHNPDKHGIDLLIVNRHGKAIGGIEAEWHGRYWKKNFPFETVHFLGRKIKYIKPHYFYMMVNNDGSEALMIPLTDLPKYEIKKMDNRLCDEEGIFDVPNEKCIWGWKDINNYLDYYFNVIANE